MLFSYCVTNLNRFLRRMDYTRWDEKRCQEFIWESIAKGLRKNQRHCRLFIYLVMEEVRMLRACS